MIRTDSPVQEVARRVLVGGLAGGAIAIVFLLVGLVRFAFFALRGGNAQAITWADVRPMSLYVVAFVLGGAFVGLVRPLIKDTLGVYLALAAAGAIVMNVIGIALRGWSGMDSFAFVAMTLMGALFGLAGAYGLTKG